MTATFQVAEKIVVRRKADRLYVKSSFALKDVAKTIPGYRWDKTSTVCGGRPGEWHYPATPEVAARIRKAYARQTLAADAEFVALLEAARDAVVARDEARREDLPDFPGRTEGWVHQRQAYRFGIDQQAVMLAIGMGGGKSKTAVGLLEGWNANDVLVICPRSVLDVWPSQFAQHSTESYGWNVVRLDAGSVRQRVAQADAALKLDQPTVIVINYEATIRPEFREWAVKQEWDAVVLDESHRIKAPGGVTSTFMQTLGRRAKRRLCLTGTPMPHSPLDVYSQFRFLDPGIFGTNFQRFKMRYAVMGGYEGREIQGWQNEDELAENVGKLAYIMPKEDLDVKLGLPPYEHVTRATALDGGAKVYAQVEADFVASLPEAGATVTADNVLTKLLRLQQVTSGHVGTDDGEVVVTGEEKSKLLADVMEDLEPHEPVVVFTRFVHDLNVVKATAEKQGRRYGEVSGRRKDLTSDAKMPPDIDVLAVQIQSGGVGIDLSRAAVAIYYSLGFSLGDYEQSLARVHRPGQTRPTTYVHLLCKGTVDEVVYSALRERKQVVDAVIEAARGGELG